MGNSLRWEALWYVDWISVNGETDGDAEGMGDGIVSVGITHGQGTRDTSAATITFIYYDVNTGEEVGRKDVNVCRCICGCEQFEVLDVIVVSNCDCNNFEIVDVQMLCGCDRFEIDQTPLSWEWEETSVKEIPFTRNCIDSELILSVTSSTANHFNAVLTENSVKVNPSGENSGEAPITGTLTISYSSPQEPNCSKKIELTHNKMICNCNNFEVTDVITR